MEPSSLAAALARPLRFWPALCGLSLPVLALGPISGSAIASAAAGFAATGYAATGSTATGQDGATPKGDRKSLEDLLKEIEIERARATAELKPNVVRIIDEIDSLRNPRTGPVSIAKMRALEKLCPGALPLLVPFLDPGEEAGRPEIFRSRLVSDVLRKHPSAATTDLLIGIAKSGSDEASINALHALETSPEPTRITPTIEQIAKRSSSGQGRNLRETSPGGDHPVRWAAFKTLSQLDDPRAQAFISTALKSTDTSMCGAALAALAAAPVESSASQVLGLLTSQPDAEAIAGAVAEYYSEHNVILKDVEHARALGAMAVDKDISNAARIRMFDVLRVTDAKIGTPIKRLVNPYAEASRPDVRTAALKLLARLKDRGARRTLLEEFDERVDANKKSVSAYTDRALMLHEIGDWSAAVKDWRVVMTAIGEDRGSTPRKEPFLGIARSLARQKKFREAASYLSKAPISMSELRELADEIDFREMLESRYADTFRVKR